MSAPTDHRADRSELTAHAFLEFAAQDETRNRIPARRRRPATVEDEALEQHARTLLRLGQ